jgi:hypothetical protein
MKELKQLEELTGDVIVLGYCHLEAEKYTNQFKSGLLSEDEYKELMTDLKRTVLITDSAHDLSIRSKTVTLLDNIMLALGVVL